MQRFETDNQLLQKIHELNKVAVKKEYTVLVSQAKSALELHQREFIDCPGMDEHIFHADLFENDGAKKHQFSVPIFVYNLSSGTPDLETYRNMLKNFEGTENYVFFVLTHISSLIENF